MSTSSTNSTSIADFSSYLSSTTPLSIKPIPDYLTTSTLFEKKFMEWFFKKCPTLEAVRDFIKAEDDKTQLEYAPNVNVISNGVVRQVPVKGMYFDLVDDAWQRGDSVTRVQIKWQNIRTPNPISGQQGMLVRSIHPCCLKDHFKKSPGYLAGFSFSDRLASSTLSPTTTIDIKRWDTANGCEFDQEIKKGSNRWYDIRPPDQRNTGSLTDIYNDSRDYIQIGLWENKFVWWFMEGVSCYCNTCDYKSGWMLDLKTKGQQDGGIISQTGADIGSDLSNKTGRGWVSLAPDILALKPSVLKMFVDENNLKYFTCNFSLYKDKMDPQLQQAFTNPYFPYKEESAVCDSFMDQYCNNSTNRDDSTCGCVHPWPSYSCPTDARSIVKDQDCLAKLIKDNQPPNTPDGIAVCIAPKCRTNAAYRFDMHRTLTKGRNLCPSQCLNILNVVADKYSEVNMSAVNQVMNCSGEYRVNTGDIPTENTQQTINNSSYRPPQVPSTPPPTDGVKDESGSGGDGSGGDGSGSSNKLTAGQIAAIIIVGIVVIFGFIIALIFALKKK